MLGWSKPSQGADVDKELIDQWVSLDKQIKELERKRDAVQAALGPLQPGTELEGVTSKVRVQDRAVLSDAKLEQQITPALWRSITKRVVVADLLKAAMFRGKISQDVVKKCTTRSKVWLKAIV